MDDNREWGYWVKVEKEGDFVWRRKDLKCYCIY